MDKQLLDILVCPVSGMPVTVVDAQHLAEINARIAAGQARYADGSPAAEPLAAALATSDRATIYRIDDGIPVMIPAQSIELAPSDPGASA